MTRCSGRYRICDRSVVELDSLGAVCWRCAREGALDSPIRRIFPLFVLIFFCLHWHLSVFCQTFFLHRYGAHSQFHMSRGWERFFYLLTYASQGPSFLHPKAYAVLHRMHHAYSDTERDPHSPEFHKGPVQMMWKTKKSYDDFAYGRTTPDARFDYATPSWPLLDKMGQSWLLRLTWVALYTLFYARFATQPWMWALLPFHFVMGPVHGAIVNWCGHRYGYRNYETHDVSRNSLFIDFVTWGELFQNNHHRHAMSPKFAVRRFEFDPCWPVIALLAQLGVIELSEKSLAKPAWPDVPDAAPAADPAE